ncbi:hypothetical protein COCCADRAFT_36916 [Bipolaris zeicola 26-R-13]|uniref:Uncharacterized protein n=1 Tax=Cochliobolus carbonum (strain 26-R-13) TaxID=930089 RepID=W6Y614_COCC2|nr:uncharacterized protein COCCADRAFT_36916 [Bipolaris zeicola 26-R-13]EUC33248.1 hypothetical protein COCCADRAFT_36916 [Bipolaris zeicola 26-R-13]
MSNRPVPVTGDRPLALVSALDLNTFNGQVLYKAVVMNCAGGNMYGNISLLTDIVVGFSRGEALYKLLEHVEVQGWNRIMEVDMRTDR